MCTVAILPIWIYLFLLGCLQSFLENCHPVPIPGASGHTMLRAEAPCFQPTAQRLLTDFSGFHGTRCKGEGCHGSTPMVEATDWTHTIFADSAKCGHPPPMDFGPRHDSRSLTAVHKRSFRRACKRALIKGASMYHGRLLTISDFPAGLIAKQRAALTAPQTGTRAMPSLPTKHPRINILTWNPGGMSASSLIELRAWLRHQPIDVVVLPETRWGYDRCWNDDKWAYIHTASTEPRSGGILVMLAKRLIQPENLGFEVVQAGRILHVRLHFQTYNIDLVGVYQFSDNGTSITRDKRQGLWKTLDGYLEGLPNRNNLICCGDFNCSLAEQHPWVGSSTFEWHGAHIPGPRHGDMETFAQLVRRHSLTALNTWTMAGPTYFHGQHASRIDFAMTRLAHSDGQSKHVQYLTAADFLPPNSVHHIPMVFSIRHGYTQFHHHKVSPSCTYMQRAACRTAQEQDSDTWLQLSQRVADTCRSLQQAPLTPDDIIRELHDTIKPTVHALFPTKPNRLQPVDYTPVETIIRNKWVHRRALIRLRCHTQSQRPGVLFQAWYHWCKCRVLQRTQQKEARFARAKRFRDLCTAVDAAATTHDAHTMFHIINQFSPKHPPARARLRNKDGKLANQHEAHALTVAYVRTAWDGPELRICSDLAAPGDPFQVTDLETAIMQLHGNRSVAAPYLPAVIWKGAPRELAELLMTCLQQWWSVSPPVIPACWKNAWLYFLPKPGKPCTHPEQLRPIALMEPIGKLILGLIADQLKSFVAPRLSRFPHFGFLPRRAAVDAITRVVAHCRRVRQFLGAQRRTVYQQMADAPKIPFGGGIQLFLDMTRAFDMVCRNTLIQHLVDIQVPSPLISIIAHWHQDTHYNLMHQELTASIPVYKGLRQGCKAAPILWVIYMDKFLSLLEQKTGADWIAHAVTFYADDLHAGQLFYSSGEFQRCLTCFGHILDTIESLHLQFSSSKSFLILGCAGTNCRRGLKGHIQRTADGCHVLIPRGTGAVTALPLRSRGKYLGTELSYHTFEHQTWLLRKKAGWTAFRRLKVWFRSRQLTTAQRLHLWQSCVWSVLTYGLFSTSMTVKEIHDFQGTTYQMVRMLLHDHAYQTGHTHQQVFMQHGLTLPLRSLACHAIACWQRLQRRAQHLHHTDFLHRVDWTHLPELVKLIECVQYQTAALPVGAPMEDIDTSQARHECPHCHFCTTSVANLRRHLTCVHQISQYRTSTTSPLTRSYQGKPQCNQCFTAFTTWRRFFIHVERDCCQADRPMMEVPLPDQGMPDDAQISHASDAAVPALDAQHLHVAQQEFWPQLKDAVINRTWAVLTQVVALSNYLAHTCLYCGLWINRCQELHLHIRTHHPRIMPGCLMKSSQITCMLASPSPCQLCGRSFKRGHCCPVATQSAALMLHVLGPRSFQDATMTCDVCDQRFASMTEVHQHLHAHHGLQVHDWAPARDALPYSDGCAHCGQTFESRAGLRRHILDGRCMEFDPFASSIQCDTTGKWGQVIEQGFLARPLLTPHQRQELTLTCQLCGVHYSRQNDLGAHLHQSHGEVWAQSQPMLRFLLQTVLALCGCQCNPCANEQGRTHICCCLRQIAMIYCLGPWDLLVPTQFDRPALSLRFAHLMEHGATTHIIEALQDRNFTALWQNPFIVVFLRHWCVICGGHFHPAALVHHLLSQHLPQCQWAAQIKFQLLDCMLGLQPNDFHCISCEMYYNASIADPNGYDTNTMRVHFETSCPVLNQIALLLLPIAERLDNGAGPSRHGTSGLLSGTGTPVQGSTGLHQGKRRRTTGQKVQTQERGSKLTRVNPRLNSQSSRPGRNDAPHGQDPPDPRPAAPTDSPAGLLRYLHPSKCTGSHSDVSPMGQTMERPIGATPEGSGGPEPANASATSLDSGGACASSAPESKCPRRGVVDQGTRAQHHPPGWLLAISEMEPHHPESDTITSGPDAHGSIVETAGPLTGPAAGQHTGGQVSLPETTGGGGALVPPTQPPSGGCLAHPGGLGPIDHVEPARPLTQGPLLEPCQARDSSSADASGAAGLQQGHLQGLGQRQACGQEQGEGVFEAMMDTDRYQLRQALTRLSLYNSGSLCYANSAVVSCLWSILSRCTFCHGDWGSYASQFAALLFSTAETPVPLDDLVWFQHLIQTWEDRQGQADSSEFLQLLMRGVKAPCYSCAWERRLLQDQKKVIHDCSDAFTPISLQLDPEACASDGVHLTALLRHWHAELGMVAGLLQASEMCCCHIDRLVHGADGQVCKLHTAIQFGGPIRVPVFEDDFNCRWVEYQVTAIIAHLGESLGGHYITLLRTACMDQAEGTAWMHCDDHRIPLPCHNLPSAFLKGITCLWLCRQDVVEFHRCPPTTRTPLADQVIDPAAATIAMLESLPPGSGIS